MELPMIIFILNLLDVAFLHQGIDFIRRVRCGNPHHNGKFLYRRLSQCLNTLHAIALHRGQARFSFFELGKDLHIKINPKLIIQVQNDIFKHGVLSFRKSAIALYFS